MARSINFNPRPTLRDANHNHPRPTLRDAQGLPWRTHKVGREFIGGQLLVEILLAISVTAIVVALGAQMTFVSLKSNRLTGERDTATALTREELEAVRAIAHEDWVTFAGTTGSSTPNYTSEDTTLGRWKFQAGVESTTTNLTTFQRYFSVASTSRTTTAIDTDPPYNPPYNPAYDDPSTKLVSVSVSWPGGGATTTEYITRWRNKVCYQTSWAGGAGQTGGTGQTCPTTAYDTKDTTINATTDLQL
jgi:hypothetical protein